EPGYSGDGGPAVQARLNGPVDLEVADDGTIYFADTMNNCVRKIDTAGIISTVAGQCGQGPLERGFAGDGGDPLQATLNLPIGIEVDGDRLYIADLLNHRVRVVNF
ncbi:MAG TPA: hypothetical protein VKZ63_20785, partial [Kofleriaceae bacterium]|nr:hypothetical protein [Kofleriaceae bacterium]